MDQAASRLNRIERWLFWATLALAGSTLWIADRPPLTDLAQHAAQVTLWRDLLQGRSQWQSLVYLNYFTPYLVGYTAVLVLLPLMPAVVALKLLLTLALFAFVGACILLRREFGSDPRLDWLFIPSFFGFAYACGLFSFVLAAPVGLVSIWLGLRYARTRTPALGLALTAANLMLFFSHGLLFLFANAIAVLFLPWHVRSAKRLAASLWPYALTALLGLAYMWLQLAGLTTPQGEPPAVRWDPIMARLKFLVFPPSGSAIVEWYYGPFELFFAAVPFLLGLRLNRREPRAFLPLLAVALVWALVPDRAVETSYIYQRFGMFVLPFLALCFAAESDRPLPAKVRRLLGHAGVVLACWAWLAIHSERLFAFAHEAKDFDAVLALASPNQRALGLVIDRQSRAVRFPAVYVHFPLWYQAEKSGLVDYNFARSLAMIVHYRSDVLPDGTGGGWLAATFDWQHFNGRIYRYFFVRSEKPLSADYFAAGACTPSPVKTAGAWYLFENTKCFQPE